MQQFAQQLTQKGASSSAEDSVHTPSAIMVPHYRVWSPAAVGVMFPVMSEASIKMELQKKAAALQVSGCRACLWPLAEAGEAEGGLGACRIVLVEDLCLKVKVLSEDVSRLHSI